MLHNNDTYTFVADFVSATFVQRKNRFVVEVLVDNILYGASLPNPGRIQELLTENAELILAPTLGKKYHYPYRVEAVRRNNEWIMLNTIRTNDVVACVLENHQIPSLAHYSVLRREITVGESRFDFLLIDKRTNTEMLCEVKSCSLFSHSVAMFPDAVTARGTRHVRELTDIASNQRYRTAVIFLIQSQTPHFFLPDFHTDPYFSESLYQARNSVSIIPVLSGWEYTNKSFRLMSQIREIPIEWSLYESHGREDRGHCLILVKNEETSTCNLLILTENLSLSKIFERFKKQYCGEWGEQILAHWTIRRHDLSSRRIAHLFSGGISTKETETGHLVTFDHNPMKTPHFQNDILRLKMEFPLQS